MTVVTIDRIIRYATFIEIHGDNYRRKRKKKSQSIHKTQPTITLVAEQLLRNNGKC